MVEKSLENTWNIPGSTVIEKAKTAVPAVIQQCELIHLEIENLLTSLKPLHDEASFSRLARLRWLFQKSKVNVLRSMLESLKTTLHLMVSTVDLETARQLHRAPNVMYDLLCPGRRLASG